MALLVRERPPLALCLSVTPPGGGPSARWGADDPRVENVPDGLAFSTTIPGGFAQLNTTLQRDRRLFYSDEKEFATITALGLGGRTVAWQGRLEQFPDVAGFQAQVNPQASGFQSHLDDDDSAQVLVVDQTFGAWGSPSLTRQISLTTGDFQLADSQVAADPTSNTPALVQSITDSWVSPNTPVAEAWYDAGPGGLIAKVYYSLSDPLQGAGFGDVLLLSSDANVSTTETSGPITSGTAGYFSPGTAYRFALVQHLFDSSGGGGAQGAIYNAYWHNLVAYGDHGLVGQGADPVGFLASDMIAYTVGRWCPLLSYTTGANGTIQPSAFVIPQAVFNTPTTASTIIKQLAGYELLDWAVWELGSGPLAAPAFYLNPYNARGKQWRARVGPAQLQNNGPNVSRIWNGVIVQFTNVDGTTGTVGPPGSGAAVTDSSLLDPDPLNPANQVVLSGGQSLRRWAPLQMGTTTSDAAIQTGARFLQAQKELDSSGQAALVGHVEDSSGVLWPSWMVRAGDQITFVDAASSGTAPRRIVSTNYDHGSKTNSIQLDQPPDSLDALLERLSVVIQPAGFS